jgi:hypothetical protein
LPPTPPFRSVSTQLTFFFFFFFFFWLYCLRVGGQSLCTHSLCKAREIKVCTLSPSSRPLSSAPRQWSSAPTTFLAQWARLHLPSRHPPNPFAAGDHLLLSGASATAGTGATACTGIGAGKKAMATCTGTGGASFTSKCGSGAANTNRVASTTFEADPGDHSLVVVGGVVGAAAFSICWPALLEDEGAGSSNTAGFRNGSITPCGMLESPETSLCNSSF